MKKYKFDYLREMVNEWADKTHITRQQLRMLPNLITLPYIDIERELYTPSKDYYGEIIYDVEDWQRQRDEYLDALWEELGSYVDPILSKL